MLGSLISDWEAQIWSNRSRLLVLESLHNRQLIVQLAGRTKFKEGRAGLALISSDD
jgi:hypothetical protein